MAKNTSEHHYSERLRILEFSSVPYSGQAETMVFVKIVANSIILKVGTNPLAVGTNPLAKAIVLSLSE